MACDADGNEVGYQNPPRHSRFKPGESGNPSGRRNPRPNFAEDLAAELREQITVRQNGRELKITKQRAFVKALTALAIKGDIRAINALVACARNFAPDPQESAPDKIDPDDFKIMAAFVERQRAGDAHNEKSFPETDLKEKRGKRKD